MMGLLREKKSVSKVSRNPEVYEWTRISGRLICTSTMDSSQPRRKSLRSSTPT
jgi:hypothetical protein